MSFAGVSLIRDGKLWPSAPAISDAGSASGYHLLVVEGYSHTNADVPNGGCITSHRFRVGGYLWYLKYYPNGILGIANLIHGGLALDQHVAEPVKAQFRFSFINQADEQEPSRIRAEEVYKFPSNAWHLSNLLRMKNSQHLKDGSFTIRCDVVVVEDANAKAASGYTSASISISAASPFVVVPPPDMQRHFTDLLMAREGTDVTFKVSGETFAAHRCILAARSKVFKAELLGPMKEGTATNGTILVEDMEAQVFSAMLAFIYSDSEPEDDGAVIWQHLLVAADRYDLQRLKLMCEDKLCGFIDVNTTATILALAERHLCDGLKNACYDFLGAPGNLKAIAATDGFDHLVGSCPSVVKELIAMFAP